MPMMDGFMFIEEFEKLNLKNKDTRIVLLTSSINPEDEQKSKKYDVVDKFLKKPLTEDVLLSL
jgi:CheY-like chemotaxis protein